MLGLKLNKFYLYQKNRFPVLILTLSLVPPILSTISVTKSSFYFAQFFSVVLVSVMYLLHIRIFDEQRDFQHDNIYHTDRLIQQGVISLSDLKKIDIFVVLGILTISILQGVVPFLFCILMLTYSFFAKHEFFLGEKIRKHFFIYNLVNILQMFLMQLFAYSVFLKYFEFNHLILLHYLFTCTGTIIFEFLRKLKIPGEDGEGKDTYTHYLTFKWSVVVNLFFIIVNSILFYFITLFFSKNILFLIFTLVGVALIGLVSILHLVNKNSKTDKLLQLNVFLVYSAFNLIIYFV